MNKYKNILKSRLSDSRYEHSINVAQAANKLAKRYNVNEDKAYGSALLHDICKELNDKEQLEMLDKYNIHLDYISKNSPKVWHSKTGAQYIKHELNINDDEIIDAVAYHTTARAKMSMLEKIIYIADLISIERDYPDVEHVRKLAFEDIDKCMLFCLEYSIASLLNRKCLIASDTFEAYNYYLAKDKNLI